MSRFNLANILNLNIERILLFKCTVFFCSPHKADMTWENYGLVVRTTDANPTKTFIASVVSSYERRPK